MYLEGFDEYDKKILEILKENARMSYSDIGKQVGISRVSVKKRMDILEEKGIIHGYHTVINPTNAPEGIRFILDLETTPEEYEDVVSKLAGSRFIRQIYSVSGECSIHATGYVSNSRNMQIFANSIYRESKKGIRRMSCKPVLSTIMDIDGGVEYERYQEPEHLERGKSGEPGQGLRWIRNLGSRSETEILEKIEQIREEYAKRPLVRNGLPNRVIIKPGKRVWDRRIDEFILSRSAMTKFRECGIRQVRDLYTGHNNPDPGWSAVRELFEAMI